MNTFKILNLGAGVQSTALYIMSINQDEPEHVPAFDCAIMADTQEEPKAVYEHIEWLRSLGGPPIMVATKGKLGDDLISGCDGLGGRYASIPAFTMAEGDTKEGRQRRQCTRDYKINVIERVIRRICGAGYRRHIPKNVHVNQYIGLSLDEPSRIRKVQARYLDIPWATVHFPLFDMQWERADCQSYLKEKYPDREFVRSACVFCPYHDNSEWIRLRDTDPESWKRAIEVDELLRAPGSRCNKGLGSKLYLHRSCVPLAQAEIDGPESRLAAYQAGLGQDCEGMCGL